MVVVRDGVELLLLLLLLCFSHIRREGSICGIESHMLVADELLRETGMSSIVESHMLRADEVPSDSGKG